VIPDARPFEEDFWQRVTIGDTVLRAVKACERCVITTVDQAEGVLKGPEPLKTLATFRRKVTTSLSASTSDPKPKE
jgi:uncharacterized protein YcbX